MAYVLFSSVFLTLFLLVGACSFFGFLELMRTHFPLNWTCYQHVIVLAIVAIVCFIAACIFGAQIPECYVP